MGATARLRSILLPAPTSCALCVHCAQHPRDVERVAGRRRGAACPTGTAMPTADMAFDLSRGQAPAAGQEAPESRRPPGRRRTPRQWSATPPCGGWLPKALIRRRRGAILGTGVAALQLPMALPRMPADSRCGASRAGRGACPPVRRSRRPPRRNRPSRGSRRRSPRWSACRARPGARAGGRGDAERARRWPARGHVALPGGHAPPWPASRQGVQPQTSTRRRLVPATPPALPPFSFLTPVNPDVAPPAPTDQAPEQAGGSCCAPGRRDG